jgi:hypothetical protein
MRELTVDDAPVVGELLARSFVEDPPIVWLFPDPDERADGMRAIFTANARLGAALGHAVLTDEGGACGLFLPPDVVVDQNAVAATGLAAATAELDPERASMLTRFLETLSSLHKRTMPEPHRTLAFLGSLPEARGTGQAAQVIDDLHRRADATGHPCFLDTLSEWNVGYYQRRGYQLIGEDRVPESPLTAWAMRRDPAR